MERKPTIWQVISGSCSGMFSLIRGMRLLRKMDHRIVTIYGGTRPHHDDPFVAQAYAMAYLLAKNNYAVLTGGGPGMMQSANCGAAQARKDGARGTTLGIGVTGIDITFKNPCAPVINMPSFPARKWLMNRYSCAFIVFPGGIGTADEFFDTLNLMKHHRLPHAPVILMGQDYWKPLVTWLQERAVKECFIKPEYLDTVHVTDSLDEAYRLIALTPQVQK